MKVLSLFNGISCGRVAFERAGIPVERYIAYEIDDYANKVAQDNYPNDEYYGDVFKADFKIFEGDIDIVIGGSPCTYWSIAQKNNRETTASGLGWELFSQFVRAIKEAKPKYFLYENNYSMSKDIRASINETFGFEAVLINSALASAQNRKRLYWVGKRNADGTYSRVDIQLPVDRGILLKDILETGEDLTSNEKGYTLTASYNGAVAWNTIERSQRNMVAEPVNITTDGKSQTIKAQYQQSSIANFCCYTSTYGATGVAEPVRIGTIENNLQNQSHDSKQYRVYSPDGKSTTLCGNGGGVGAKTGLYAVPIDRNAPIYPIYEVKDGYITYKGKQYPIKLADGYYIIRKLTVNECCRLQTLPDDYCKAVSNARAYKGLGNGWTVDVIAHILQGINNQGVKL